MRSQASAPWNGMCAARGSRSDEILRHQDAVVAELANCAYWLTPFHASTSNG